MQLMTQRTDIAFSMASGRSQIVFGLVAGYVVHHTKTVETMQTWPLAARAGIEAPGVMEEKDEEEQ